MDVINRLIADVEASAAPGLKDRAKGQGELCLEEARVALRKTLDAVSEAMNTQQKEISRCLAPHVQAQLADGYNRAMEERGRGSVARQKVRPPFDGSFLDEEDLRYAGAGRPSSTITSTGRRTTSSMAPPTSSWIDSRAQLPQSVRP